MNAVLLLVRIVLSLVFLIAGAAKLVHPARTRQALLEFGAPKPLTPILAWVLPLTELSVGAALVPARTAWWGAAGAFVLLILFLVAIWWNLARGRRPDCRCFGQLHSAPIGWKLVLRNLVLVGLAGITLTQPAQPIGPGLFGWLDAVTGAESVALGLALAACALAAVEAWLLSNLGRQNGRLILRLDALEAGRNAETRPLAPPATRDAPLGLPLRELAPEFELPDTEGRTVSLAALRARGRDVLLLFVDPGCGPCAALLPEVTKWRREYADVLTVAVISRGRSPTGRADATNGGPGPVLLQHHDEVAERYQTSGTPAAVVVDAGGFIASPVQQGVDPIRRLVARLARAGSPAHASSRPAARRGVAVGLAFLLAAVLQGATSSDTRESVGPYLLQTEDSTGWRTWWRSDSAPEEWLEPVPLVLQATQWRPVAPGAHWGEVVIAGGSPALRTRIVLARFDPARYRMVLSPGEGSGLGPGWTVDSADPESVVAFNGGQFTDGGAWGWVVRNGRELQRPGWGPLSMAVAVAADGEVRFVAFDSLAHLREAEFPREAVQSYPALLVGDGRVPDRFRVPSPLLDLGHRDTRLAICSLRDGRILVALTRFDNLGRVFGSLPIGLTVNEMAAIMGALGCRRAVSLDGGLSAQLAVRPLSAEARRWGGWRGVPLGVEVRARS